LAWLFGLFKISQTKYAPTPFFSSPAVLIGLQLGISQIFNKYLLGLLGAFPLQLECLFDKINPLLPFYKQSKEAEEAGKQYL
jgi:hypothetical protein